MLHFITKSPFNDTSLQVCLEMCRKGDCVVLLEDAVYAIVSGTEIVNQLSRYSETVTIYAMTADVKARGLSDQVVSDIALINYEMLVELTVSHHPIQSW